GKRCDAALLFDRMNLVASAGKDLVRIGLVADVPYQPVGRGVIEPVQRDGQLDHAQTRAEVATGLRPLLDQVPTQLIRDRGQLLDGKLAKVGGYLDTREAGVALRIDHQYGVG